MKKSSIGNIQRIEIEIIDSVYEWGKFPNGTFFDNVYYVLRIELNDVKEEIIFYSSDIKEKIKFKVKQYEIIILLDSYNHSNCLIEMVILEPEIHY